MRSMMPIRCPVLFKGAIFATVLFFHDTSLGVMAACTTSLPDASPAAGETFTVPSGACAGNINLAASNDGVTLEFLPGAEPFQAGKSIVLPASGVIVGLTVRFAGVNWGAVSQQVFSGGNVVNLELKGLNVEVKGSTITSSVSNPITFSAKITTSSRYTVRSSTISVIRSTTATGLMFNAPFTDSTLSITHGSVVTATAGSLSSAVGLTFFAPWTGSTLCMSHGSAVSVSSDEGSSAYGMQFSGGFTGSTLCMRDGSVVTVTNPNNIAYGINFSGGFTSSTVCKRDGSQLTTTGGTAFPIHPTSTTAESQCDPSECPAATATATLPEALPRTRTVSLPMTTPAPMTTGPATTAVGSSASASSGGAATISAATTAAATISAATTAAATISAATSAAATNAVATSAAATTAVVGTTAAATAAAVTTTVATSTTAAAGSASSSSGSTGNGASSVTAAALGLMTMVLAMF